MEKQDSVSRKKSSRAKPLAVEGNPFAALFGPVAIPPYGGKSIKIVDGKIENKPPKIVKPVLVGPRRVIIKTPAPELVRVSTKGRTYQKERVRQNGIFRPSEGTRCAEIWAFLDANPNTVASELPEIADSRLWDRITTRLQFYTWRRFNGIKGRV